MQAENTELKMSQSFSIPIRNVNYRGLTITPDFRGFITSDFRGSIKPGTGKFRFGEMTAITYIGYII